MSGSLADRVAARRQQVQQRRATRLVIGVPDYRDMLAGRYRILDFEDKAPIIGRFDHDERGVPADKVGFAADLLINACEELLEVTGEDENGNPQYQSLGTKWTTRAVSENFGVEFPEGTTVREAMRQALGPDAIIEHSGEYSIQAAAITKEADEAAEGEAEPSVEG